jgi:hypothetical protein
MTRTRETLRYVPSYLESVLGSKNALLPGFDVRCRIERLHLLILRESGLVLLRVLPLIPLGMPSGQHDYWPNRHKMMTGARVPKLLPVPASSARRSAHSNFPKSL